MGYSYSIDPKTGRRKLSCDSCGSPGATKRVCPHIVGGLPYCPAPALCSACFKREGGTRGVHARCEEPSAIARFVRERQDEVRARRLYEGDRIVVARFGDWHPNVPAGWVGLTVRGKNADLHHYLAWHLDDDLVQRTARELHSEAFQRDYEALAPWRGPEHVPGTYRCGRCGHVGSIVNECGCDEHNLPTQPAA